MLLQAYRDWRDGRDFRKLFMQHKEKLFPEIKEPSERDFQLVYFAAKILGNAAYEAGAGELEMTISGLTCEGDRRGNWNILCTRAE